MSVKLIDNNNFYGYRARRSIAGKTEQQYFSLIKNGEKIDGWEKDRILRAAESYDRSLLRKQKAATEQKTKELKHTERAKHSTGVRGISLRRKTYNKNGKKYSSLAFVVCCKSLLSNKTVSTTYSVAGGNWQKSWEKAVRYLAKHKKIFRYRHLIERMPPEPKETDTENNLEM
ncbi:MAG: hypothetical protein D6B27_03725 [Gammaproteobacteria bacterium]|nr:MAG: hypothetical protein D6B27_03725 [Gammaproteobacteria bacterium]